MTKLETKKRLVEKRLTGSFVDAAAEDIDKATKPVLDSKVFLMDKEGRFMPH